MTPAHAQEATETPTPCPDLDCDGILDPVEDDFIAAPFGAAESNEFANADDNCPTAYNPDQTNTDGRRRDNGPQIATSWASNPSGDRVGDACDEDDDNDWMLDTGVSPLLGIPGEDAGCGSGPTNPLVADTDGDGSNDGAECALGSDPLNPSSRPPAWPAGDSDRDWLSAAIESALGSSEGDRDSDSPTGTTEVIDGVEFKTGASPANADTDGDGCQDWIVIVDIDGNRSANVTDVVLTARRLSNVLPASNSDSVFDMDKNGEITVADVLLASKNSSLFKPHGPCTSEG
jgi:hypothetical protein